MDCSTPGFPALHHLLVLAQLISIESVMPSNHLILCCPFLLLPLIFPSIRAFANELTLLTRWPKYCNFSFSLSASSQNSGLTSFRIAWFDLLAVQVTLMSLLSSKASIHSLVLSIFYHPTFISIHDYWTNHILAIWTFVSKVMSLLLVLYRPWRGNVKCHFGSHFENTIQMKMSFWKKHLKMYLYMYFCYLSITKSCLTLQPHGLQHVRLPCPSLSPRVCSNPCLLSW